MILRFQDKNLHKIDKYSKDIRLEGHKLFIPAWEVSEPFYKCLGREQYQKVGAKLRNMVHLKSKRQHELTPIHAPGSSQGHVSTVLKKVNKKIT